MVRVLDFMAVAVARKYHCEPVFRVSLTVMFQAFVG